MTAKALAEAAKLSPVTVSRLENNENTPDSTTLDNLATALRYPKEFFFKDDPDEIDVNAVSFRSLSKMSAKERDAAISAGVLGLEIAGWVDEHFKLPKPDFLDLGYESDPETAARALREYWGIGERPIANMLRLLETKGVRVFSLSENTESVDAFSFWRNDKPFVFLNTTKTPEHSVMDAAHELAHLVLHRHAGTRPSSEQSRSAEREANQFASAFLMPRNDVKAQIRRPVSIETILKAKRRWRVSAMALTYRLHEIGHLTDWQYKSACIELGKRGFRKAEAGGIEREVSEVWRRVLTALWSERMTKETIAKQLHIPLDEFQSLIWGLINAAEPPQATSPLFLVAADH